MVIRNSIKQLMRTPMKTLFFFILLASTIMFFMLGYGLHLIAVRNIDRIEHSFITIGTVEQKPVKPNTVAFLWKDSNYTITGSPAEYGSLIPLSTLDFEGADYILKPEKRPFYVACDPGYVVSSNPAEAENRYDTNLMIVEMEPAEGCAVGSDRDYARMKIKRVLSGKLDRDEIWIQYSDDTLQMLYAGKTYIALIYQGMPHPDPNINEYVYEMDTVIASRQYAKDGQRIKDTLQVDTPWDEVTANFFESPRGKRWLIVIEDAERLKHEIPVVPTSGTKLLMAFFNGEARINEGRDISPEEYQSGEKVCLVQRNFAVSNRLTVGSSLRLPLYYADYRSSSGLRFYDQDGIGRNIDSLLNAKGEGYSAFEDSTYRIVGIYDAPVASYTATGYDLGNNAVVIPSASVRNSDENNIVAMGHMMGYTTSFQIPNGQIEKYNAAWEALDITELDIKFYDRGYSKIMAGMETMRDTATILFVVGIATMLFVLILFCHLFIAKQRKRTAIERSLGMSKSLCSVSLLAGLLFIVIAAYAFGSTAGYGLTVYTVKHSNIAHSQEAFDVMYSNWRYTVDENAISKTDVSTAGAAEGIPAAAVVIPAALLIALINIRSNLKSEPLKLLGEKER